MRRQLRWLLPIGAIVVFSIVVLALSPISLFGITRGDTSAPLGLNLGLDLQGGAHLLYEIVPLAEGGAISQTDAESLRSIIEQRINQFGVSEPSVSLIGGSPPDRLLVQIPGELSSPVVEVSFINGLVDDGATNPLPVNPLELETAVQTEFGRADISILSAAQIPNPDGTFSFGYSFQFGDDFAATQRDVDGNVIVEGDSDRLVAFLESAYQPLVTIGFDPAAPPPVQLETGAPAPAETVAPIPSLEELREIIAESTALEAFALTEPETAAAALDLFYLRADELTADSRDADGLFVPGDVSAIEDALRERYYSFVGATAAGLFDGVSMVGGIEDAKALIGSTAFLEFRERACQPLLAPPGATEWPPDGISEQAWANVRCADPRYYVERETEIDADDLVSATVGTQEGVIGPVINIQFNNDGADAFFDVTNRISVTGDLLAIYLDGEELLAPGADEPISGGRAFISGDFTTRGDTEEARRIAIQLQSGALPATLEILQEREVDATLGQDALNRSLIAAAIGLALLALFLMFYYKLPGVISTLTLVVYSVTLVATIKLIGVTLTLSGLAAIILSLGFAVDANILIAERIKEEVKSGKNVFNAISAGFFRAWPSIRDGNVSTLVIALVLFWFGDRFATSLIQGFALNLTLGIVLSMFFSYVVNRVFIRILAYSPLGRRLNLFVPVAPRQPKAAIATAGGAPLAPPSELGELEQAPPQAAAIQDEPPAPDAPDADEAASAADGEADANSGAETAPPPEAEAADSAAPPEAADEAEGEQKEPNGKDAPERG